MTTFKAQGITVDNALIVHDSTQKTPIHAIKFM